MSEEKVVKVGQLVTALESVQHWCGVVREVLLQLNPEQEIVVSEKTYDEVFSPLKQDLGSCKPH